MSVGQPQWSRPERRHNAAGTSFRAHHGCSPEPLHVWLPIDADLLMALLPRLYMVVFPITATERERYEGGKQRESTRMSAVFSGQV